MKDAEHRTACGLATKSKKKIKQIDGKVKQMYTNLKKVGMKIKKKVEKMDTKTKKLHAKQARRKFAKKRIEKFCQKNSNFSYSSESNRWIWLSLRQDGVKILKNVLPETRFWKILWQKLFMRQGWSHEVKISKILNF